MSVSCETFAKTDKKLPKVFQNERFVRGIRKKTKISAFQCPNGTKGRSCVSDAREETALRAVRGQRFAEVGRVECVKCTQRLHMQPHKRSFVQVSRIRHARSPQRVDLRTRTNAVSPGLSHPTRTISAKGCTRNRTNAVSSRFRASDTHDLRKGLTTHPHKRSFAQVSRTRHARSSQRVDHANAQTQFRLGFAHATRTISAEGRRS